jgi:NTE family protein
MDSGVMVGTQSRRNAASAASTRTKTVNLALQGGGAHGAFTWGVLDRLLEDERGGRSPISGAARPRS